VETGGARTGVAGRATAGSAMLPRLVEMIQYCDVNDERTAARTVAGHDDERLTDFSENSDAARELTIASRPSDVRTFAQKIGWSTQ